MNAFPALFLTASLAGASFSFAGTNEAIALEKVPAAILRQARAAAPTAVFTKANLETEADGTRIFEIAGTEPSFDLEVAAETPSEIDLAKLDDDGFGLQLRKVTLEKVEIEVDVFENGGIEEIERVIPARLVPGMVLQRIERSYPGFVPTRVEASYNEEGRIFRYEFEGTAGDRKLDLEVSADGSRIVEADA